MKQLTLSIVISHILLSNNVIDAQSLQSILCGVAIGVSFITANIRMLLAVQP